MNEWKRRTRRGRSAAAPGAQPVNGSRRYTGWRCASLTRRRLPRRGGALGHGRGKLAQAMRRRGDHRRHRRSRPRLRNQQAQVARVTRIRMRIRRGPPALARPFVNMPLAGRRTAAIARVKRPVRCVLRRRVAAARRRSCVLEDMVRVPHHAHPVQHDRRQGKQHQFQGAPVHLARSFADVPPRVKALALNSRRLAPSDKTNPPPLRSAPAYSPRQPARTSTERMNASFPRVYPSRSFANCLASDRFTSAYSWASSG